MNEERDDMEGSRKRTKESSVSPGDSPDAKTKRDRKNSVIKVRDRDEYVGYLETNNPYEPTISTLLLDLLELSNPFSHFLLLCRRSLDSPTEGEPQK